MTLDPCPHEETIRGEDGYGVPGLFCRECGLVLDRPPTDPDELERP